MKTFLIIIALVILAILIWGFATDWGKGGYQVPSSQVTTAAPLESQATNENEVKIANSAFSPATLEVARGKTVTWTNEDSLPHTVTADNGKFDSGQLASGKKFEFTFNDTGELTYHCGLHPNMKAKIVVK